MNQEKRTSPRVALPLAVEAESEAQYWSGRSVDLSMAGISILLRDPPPIGTALKLHFTLPGGAQVRALAVQLWTNGSEADQRIGLRFERFLEGYVELGDFLVQQQLNPSGPEDSPASGAPAA